MQKSKKRQLLFQAVLFLTLFLMVFVKTEGSFGPSLTIPIVVILLYRSNLMINSRYQTRARKKYAFLETESEFSNMLIQLIAAVIKADNKTEDSEIRFIEKSLEDYFPSQRIQILIKHIKHFLKMDVIPVEGISDYVRANFNIQSKVQLMHLLIGIAAADGLLTKKEYALLKKIAMHMRLPHATFTQILSMFRFRHEGEKQRQKRKTYSSVSRLKEAYGVIGITESATAAQIKKAYRKLAVIHHPDKVIHLGKEMQKAAKEKFQIISEAYELIKERKGFS